MSTAEKTYQDLLFHSRSFEMRAGQHLGYIQAFASTRVAALLVRSGHMIADPHRRATDTALFIWELAHAGLDSPAGRRIVERINEMHGHWTINNDDNLWVLRAFATPAIEFAASVGRPLTLAEEQAIFDWFRDLGGRLGVQDIPVNRGEWDAWSEGYIARHVVPNPHSPRLLAATLDVALSPLPRAMRPLASRALAGYLDPRVAAAVGLQRPSSVTRQVSGVVARLQAARTRGAHKQWFRPGSNQYSDYPAGYSIEDLGPRSRYAEGGQPSGQC